MTFEFVPKFAIHSVPRSGSSWLGEILNSHPAIAYLFQPLFSYRFKSALDDRSNASQIRTFFSKIAFSNDEFIRRSEDRDKGIKPTFIKKRTPEIVSYKEVRYHYILDNALRSVPEFKLIGLIRCPLAVLNSFQNAPREFRADLGWVFEQEWQFARSKNENLRENYFGYEKWKETALLFLRLREQYKGRVHIINYNSLIADPSGQAGLLFDFIGLDLHPQTKAFIDHSSQISDRFNASKKEGGVYSVFNTRSIDNSWEGKLPEKVVSYITSDLEASPLEDYLSKICP